MFTGASRRRARSILVQSIMVIAVIVFLLPVFHGLHRSFGPPGGAENYVLVLTDPRLPRFFLNTVIVCAGTILGVVVLASLAGFAFSKLRFRFSSVIFYTLLSTLLIPGATLIIPLFLLIRRLGLYNTFFALILPGVAYGVPFHTVLIKNYFDSLPNELMDAARIDGASLFGVFWRIMMPLSLPIQAVVITLTFLGAWNDYLFPLIMLKDEKMYTVSVAAVSWAHQAGRATSVFEVQYDTLFAALFILAAPTVILFLSMQRWFIGSITQGAIKA